MRANCVKGMTTLAAALAVCFVGTLVPSDLSVKEVQARPGGGGGGGGPGAGGGGAGAGGPGAGAGAGGGVGPGGGPGAGAGAGPGPGAGSSAGGQGHGGKGSAASAGASNGIGKGHTAGVAPGLAHAPGLVGNKGLANAASRTGFSVPVGPSTNPGRKGGVPIAMATRGQSEGASDAAEPGLGRAPGLVGNKGLAKAATKAGFAVPVGQAATANGDASN